MRSSSNVSFRSNIMPELSADNIAKEWLRLERICARKQAMDLDPFRIFGLRGTFEHDRLKCFVLLNQHVHEKNWPEGYEPRTPMEELLRDCDDSEEDDESVASFY